MLVVQCESSAADQNKHPYINYKTYMHHNSWPNPGIMSWVSNGTLKYIFLSTIHIFVVSCITCKYPKLYL